LQEYHEVAGRLTAETAVLDGLRAALAEQSARAESWERETAALEAALRASEDAAHEQEALLANARQPIAAEGTTPGHREAPTADLETEWPRTRARLAELDGRVAALAESAARVAEDLHAAQAQEQAQRRGVLAIEDELQRVVLRLGVLQRQLDADKKAHFDGMR